MPGGLYRFLDQSREPVTLKVNGKSIDAKLSHGFARIDREWRAGDVVEVNLPMPVRRVIADPRVQDDTGRVTLERGPIVYAAEWPDNGGHALNIVVPDDARLAGEFRGDLLGGVEVITGKVQAMARNAADGPLRAQPHQLVAIPYFAWANRGMGEMEVWLPREPDRARVAPIVPPDPIAAVYDGVNPLTSADESNLYFRMRPPTGQPAWVEYEFKRPVKISTSDVYFADDKRFCKLPASWRVMYKDGDTWRAVAASGAYSVDKDRFNHVDFAPVTTTAVRIEVEPVTRQYKTGEIGPPDAMFLNRDIAWREFGLIEWRVK